ncbi:hypothetical protein BSKO_11843 [Bryopsis sp. KO-2023]|nr:hypothetical protein BSKO_11843 [Bryopsis sp. KO-2023]
MQRTGCRDAKPGFCQAPLPRRIHKASLFPRKESFGKVSYGRERTSHVVAAEAPPKMSMKEMSAQFKSVRSTMEEDEMVASMMAGLRGANVDESNFADSDVKMQLVEVNDSGSDPSDSLPLTYDPETIAAYWSKRPVSLVTRIIQLAGLSSGFLGSVVMDYLTGKLEENEVKYAIQLRNIVTSLGPAYIKLGQALSIRPDILSPKAMNELQKLCDKVPSFDSKIAMEVIKTELGKPWEEVYAELTPEPIAAASLGQVYKGKLKSGETVAVKVQRPYVLETVTIDLYLIRKVGVFMRRFPQIKTDVVALLDEWAARFFEELDYVREGRNATKFAKQMKEDLPQVVVPKTYSDYTSRRVLTTEWLDGEKLSQSQADDVGSLVNVGVICYLKQLLETGFFHADPHPGNLIRTPDGRLAILDFGLMTEVDDNIKYGMIEAISHLIHRDYESIVKDFVTLEFIPEGTDLRPILPVLAKVFDQALEGGGAKNINFQELAADLAQITFDYPFRIPPYFALIIRAIGVLEGIALVGNSDFAIVDEAYPYVAERLLTDDSERLRAALRYMVYGKDGIFDAEKLIDLLGAFETFKVSSSSAMGDLEVGAGPRPTIESNTSTSTVADRSPEAGSSGNALPWPTALPIPAPAIFGTTASAALIPVSLGPQGVDSLGGGGGADGSSVRTSLKFLFSSEGTFFREFLMDEVVKGIDALSRDQLRLLVASMGLEGLMVPLLIPFGKSPLVPLSPKITEEDRMVIENIKKIVAFLLGGSVNGLAGGNSAQALSELAPILPTVTQEVIPEISQRLISRISARAIRDLFL